MGVGLGLEVARSCTEEFGDNRMFMVMLYSVYEHQRLMKISPQDAAQRLFNLQFNIASLQRGVQMIHTSQPLSDGPMV